MHGVFAVASAFAGLYKFLETTNSMLYRLPILFSFYILGPTCDIIFLAGRFITFFWVLFSGQFL